MRIFGKFTLLSLVCVIFAANGRDVAAQNSSLRKKKIFMREFPAYVSFRGEASDRDHLDYDNWALKIGDADVIIKKFIQEEIDVNLGPQKWISEFLYQNPERLALLHLNGEARQITCHEEVLNRYFPGHWIYLAGSKLAADISETDTIFPVLNIQPFKSKGYLMRKKPQYIPLKVIVVTLNQSGEKLWYESEYATVTGFNEKDSTIELKRGLYGTQPRSYKKWQAYIAPLAGDVWGKDAMWYYNLSSACPVDKNGKTAGEVYAEEIKSWFAPSGPLASLDGIAFDVNYFSRIGKGNRWDVNNDGIADAGWVDDRNIWMDGDLSFLEKVREYLGEDRIITCDAQLPINQQTPRIMNGMESEGLVEPMDSWRGFSRFINTHNYWNDRIDKTYEFRYVVMKIMGKDADIAQKIRKFSSASAFCLGAAVTSTANRNYVPEEFRNAGSLGKITGNLIRVAKTEFPAVKLNAEDLFDKISKENCSVRMENGKIYIKPKNPGNQKSFGFKIENVNMPEGDITIFAYARAAEPLTEYSEEFSIPRIVSLKPEKLPLYDEEEKYNKFFTDLYGMIDGTRTEELSFYFRNMPGGRNNLNLEVTGTGEVELSEIVIYGSPDVLVREFEKGIIVVNPSLEKTKVPLRKFISASSESTVIVAPLSARYVLKND